ncbi:MAG: ankyrin repeat domain-containing protein [Planctomycetota bacterium]
MKRITVAMAAAVVVLVCGAAEHLWAAESQPPRVDIWTAAGQGNTEAIQQHVSAGTDLNAKEPANGGTPLIVAAVFGQTEAARLLVRNGAELEARNNDGATALLVAAFFCHPQTVELLLENGAEVNAKNNAGETPLDVVTGEWDRELEGVYRFFAAVLQTELDLEEIRSLRPVVADILLKHGGKHGRRRKAELEAREVRPTGLKGAYTRNGRLHVAVFGGPDGEPITAGPGDMKPSWSKTSGEIVFFRVTKFASDVLDWKTAICVVHADGTGFRKLTDGTHTDFNPTWTRDGTEKAVFNRRDPGSGSFSIHMTTAEANPGDEHVVSDRRFSSYAYTCLKDSRMFVSCGDHPSGPGYFLMNPSTEGKPTYERVNFAFGLDGTIDRVSLSPGEKKLCYEFQKGFGPYRYPGRTLYIADFDVASRTVSHPVAITDAEPDPEISRLYPRWTNDESAVVYHCDRSGMSQLYMYRLKDKSTILVSTNPGVDYMFPCGENTPK